MAGLQSPAAQPCVTLPVRHRLPRPPQMLDARILAAQRQAGVRQPDAQAVLLDSLTRFHVVRSCWECGWCAVQHCRLLPGRLRLLVSVLSALAFQP
jgi:hypothetical protein